MAPIRRVVLDTLKPHDPSLAQFVGRIADLDGVTAATASLVEMDREVQNVTLAVEGETLDLDAVEEAVRDLGGTIHSVDEVACGDHIVEADGGVAGGLPPAGSR